MKFNVLIFIIILLLVSCNKKDDESFFSYIRTVKSRDLPNKIFREKTKNKKIISPVSFKINRDPFVPYIKSNMNKKDIGEFSSCSVKSMRLVGFLRTDENHWALISCAKNLINHFKIGDYLDSQDKIKLIIIKGNYIEIEEKINRNGLWVREIKRMNLSR